VDAALAGVPEAGLTTPNTALPSDVQACVTAGPSLAGEIVGALRYRAVGAFSGTDAVFLAYDRPAAPPARRLLVLARNSCTPLASRPF